MSPLRKPLWLFGVVALGSTAYYFLLLASGLMANRASLDSGVPAISALLLPALLSSVLYVRNVDWYSYTRVEHSVHAVLTILVAPYCGFWLLVFLTFLVTGETL